MIKDEVVVFNHKNEIVWRNDTMDGLFDWFMDYMVNSGLSVLEIAHHIFISRKDNKLDIRNGAQIGTIIRNEVERLQMIKSMFNAPNN